MKTKSESQIDIWTNPLTKQANFSALKPIIPGSVTYVSAKEGIKELEAEFAREDEEKRKRELEEKRRTDEEVTIPPVVPEARSEPKVSSAGDYLRLENLVCHDANNQVIESYPKLYVAKDVDRNADGKPSSRPIYWHAVEMEKDGCFEPSFALSCAIIALLYQHRDNPEYNKVLLQYESLMQYNGLGGDTGWHAQNTIIDWTKNKIIHYPRNTDFPNGGYVPAINSKNPAKEYKFNPASLTYGDLEIALRYPDYQTFIRNLTGLVFPEILVMVGKHFNRVARVWTPDRKNEVCSGWLGCGNSDFYHLATSTDLNKSVASRRVKLG